MFKKGIICCSIGYLKFGMRNSSLKFVHLCVRLEAESCLGSHCQMPGTSLSDAAFDAPNCQVNIHTYIVCVCVHKCRIICSSGPLGLSWLFGWRCSGFGGLSITQTPRTLIMLMICNSFGAVEKLFWNSRVIHVAFPSKRSACDFSLWPFLLLLLLFSLPFSFAVSLCSVCERAHLHFEPLCSLLSSLLLPARRRRTTTRTENHKEGCNRTL